MDIVANVSILFGALGIIFLSAQYRNTTNSIDRFVLLCQKNLDKVNSSADDVAMRFKLFQFELMCLVGMCVAFVFSMVQIFAMATSNGKTSNLTGVVYFIVIANFVLITMLLRRLWVLERTKNKILK